MNVALAAMLLLSCAVNASAAAADAHSAPYFSVNGTDGVERLPLLQTTATVDIVGPIADVTLKQTFENRGSAKIEATYVFPASDRGAVSALTMRIGERVVQARIQERGAAKQTYEAAKQTGHTAALLEQHDPGTFVMNLANILPGDRIDVELHYTELLVPTDGIYELELANTFGVERYTRRGDASVATPRSDAPEVTDYSFAINVRVMAGVPIASIESPSHHVVIDKPTSAEADVRLADDEVKASTRDFVLRYSLAGGEISNGLSLFPGPKENFFLLLTQPPRSPAAASVAAREYIFILDVSGSMSGQPMDAAKAMMHTLLSTLLPHDRFNLVLFAGSSDVLSKQGSLAVGEDTIGRAMSMIDDAKASGGTELIAALEAAYALPHANGMSRSIVIVTDGGISAGGDAARLIRSHLDEANLFAFGVGAGADRPVMRRLARAGLGEPFVAEDADKGMVEIKRFRKYVEQPLLTHVGAKFNGFDAYDVIPERLPDLFAQRPIVLIGKYRGPARGEIVLTGTTTAGPYSSVIDVAGASSGDRNSPLRALWARERIADELDANAEGSADAAKDELVKLSLDYDVLTPYTAFVAVSEEQRTDASEPVKVNQPTPLRASMSGYSGGYGDALQAGLRLVAGLSASSIARPMQGDIRELAGKQFRQQGETWIDLAHDAKCITLRIRRGSAAYARLLELRPELAAWFALGDRVLIRLGRYSVLVGADGFSDYATEILERAARG
jgi:Ca-activated chloride channel family protein